jgi:hypothetical protein
MEEFGTIAAVVALWVGVSCALWWLHRRSAHGRQERQLAQARRAAAHAAEAQGVLDAIRALDGVLPSRQDLQGATYVLLKRVQEHGAYFDKVNALRVDIQASLGVEDHAALSEILHLRRDLWAASEIVLLEDPASFGAAFSEEGAYERFRDEAVTLLFKAAGGPARLDDPIDLRLALARKDAEDFTARLQDAIAAAREKDRLPTLAEATAYPLAILRAAPEKLRLAALFLRELVAYSAELARAIRDSETMERGRRHLQRASEDLPRRLSSSFERASGAARESAASLRKHYDFLVAAHDFQSKYEQVLRGAPRLTERGRQFIARLDLAERSERLRLTSANIMVWLARRSADGLALLIAGSQRFYAVLSQTTPWELTAMALAPLPTRGRYSPAFRSYRMALAAGGLAPPSRAPVKPPTPRSPPPAKARAVSKARKAVTRRKAKAATGIEIPAIPPAPPPAHPPPPPQEPWFKRLLAKPANNKGGKSYDAKPASAPLPPPVPADAGMTREPDAPREPPPTLLEKLSMIEEDAANADTEAEAPPEDLAAGPELADDKGEAAGEPGPLTLSLMELQAKAAAKAGSPQIRAFPWLRG